MRILIAGHFKYNMHYGILHKLYHAYIRLGHCVMLFDDRTIARAATIMGSRTWGIKPMNRRFFDAALCFEPDVILLGHAEMIHNETLQRIKDSLPSVRLIYRNVDPLIHPQNCRDIMRRTTMMDWIFVTTAGEGLKQFAGANAKIAYMPNPIDPAIETGTAFANAHPVHDVFYAIGGVYHNDPRPTIAAYVQEQCPNVSFHIRGMKGGDTLFGPKYINTLGQCAMGISYSRINNHYLYASDRMAQYMGNGLLALVDRATGFEDIFPSTALGYYSTVEELADKIRYFKENDSERRTVAAHGHRLGHTLFHTDTIAQYMLDCALEKPFTHQYAWPTHAY
jgi:Glycosyl transferases group 1